MSKTARQVVWLELNLPLGRPDGGVKKAFECQNQAWRLQRLNQPSGISTMPQKKSGGVNRDHRGYLGTSRCLINTDWFFYIRLSDVGTLKTPKDPSLHHKAQIIEIM